MPSNFQQQVKQATPYVIEEATVVSYDPRDTRSLAIRTSGGRVIRNCAGATTGLTAGVHVLVVINRFGSGAVVIGAVQDSQTVASSGNPIQALNPPANLAVVAGYRFLVAQWDFYPGNNSICYQVQHNAAAAEDGNQVSALVTKGSQYVYDCVANTLHYFRVRALQYLSASNLMYSAWSSWVSGTARGIPVQRTGRFEGTVGQNVFTLPSTAAEVEWLALNGLIEDPAAYSLTSAGASVTLDNALTSATLVLIRYQEA
jgi:hypothetical protein